MLKFLNNLLDDNAKEIKRLQKRLVQINDLESSISVLSDSQLQEKTNEFKTRLQQGETLDDLLPEAFAVMREASKRVLGMRHFDVQLLGGMVLHSGKIAEMRTGEGKTLVATLPVYLNALTGKGVHVVTVNDYLARRDSEWMGRVYKFLGFSVGLIVHGLNWSERKHSYSCDVTYGTNNEFGFDYLRDNMVAKADHLVQRPLYYAIVDEVDSILVDEARTPLIISGEGNKATDLYLTFAKLVPRLRKEEDYTTDEKARTAVLTEEGIVRVEKMLGIENLYDDANIELSHHLNQALRAQTLMKRDRDYVVKDGEVIIVDEFTGRLMFGRRYSDGLHQAIEAKENVRVEKESQTLASITFQNYFRMYEKLAGMTGTAETEQEEFRKIYNLDVVVIPTNKPMARKELPDAVYKTEQAKFNAVVEEIVQKHATGQPVLVGTISIEKSERLHDMLRKRGIHHQVLNAKFHEKEAEIVAQAGKKGAVTIATNMAGRGTDIVLGGNPEFLAQSDLRSRTDYDPEDVMETKKLYDQLLERYEGQCAQEHKQVVELGGLHIIGTERHESRRIDNQLRGRSGRQGDPGASQFFSSLEDDLMRLFGSDNVAGIMDKLGMEEDMPIESNLISRSIESAQKRVENRNFDTRKHVLEYDDVMNQQREVIYRQRMQVLQEENLKDVVIQMITDMVFASVETYAPNGVIPEEWDLEGLLNYTGQAYLSEYDLTVEDIKDMGRNAINDLLLEKSLAAYESREAELSAKTMRELERAVLLKVVDEKWMDHLDAMDQLREGIGLRSYGQKNPLVEYKFEGYEMFQNMIDSIRDEVVRLIFRIRVLQTPEMRHTVENKYQNEGSGSQTPVRKKVKIGRNDPCPCGSGKKYKNCCGANQ